MDACLLDGVQMCVQVEELLMHLIKILADVVVKGLEQLLHVGGGGSHGSSGLRIPGVRVLLGGVVRGRQLGLRGYGRWVREEGGGRERRKGSAGRERRDRESLRLFVS